MPVNTIPARASLLRAARVSHLYIGMFTAPALLFFALSGALQTFNFHSTSRDGSYHPARWILILAQLHKHQSAQLPPPRRPQPATGAKSEPAAALPSSPAAKPAATRHPLPLRIFFLVVSLGLFSSVITGLYMSFRFSRNRTLVTLTLLLGILLPVALIFV